MTGYPVVLTGLNRRRCVVVGGGQVAARKVKTLVEAGARPIVISPELCADLEQALAQDGVMVLRRAYQRGDLEGAALVIAATNDRAVNQAIADECQQRDVLLNVVDCPELCTFTLPSIIRRGALLVAIATGGGSPGFARHVRETLDPILDAAYGDMLEILSELRPFIRRNVPRSTQRSLWERLLDGEVMCCVRTEGVAAARTLAEQIVRSYCECPTE